MLGELTSVTGEFVLKPDLLILISQIRAVVIRIVEWIVIPRIAPVTRPPERITINYTPDYHRPGRGARHGDAATSLCLGTHYEPAGQHKHCKNQCEKFTAKSHLTSLIRAATAREHIKFVRI